MLVRIRSRKDLVWSITGVALLLTAAAIGGCSNHDKGTNNTNGQSLAEQVLQAPDGFAGAEIEPVAATIASDASLPVEEETITVPREVTYEEAEAAYNEGRYDGAADLFQRYTETRAENPWGFYMLGLSSWKSGDYSGAESAFQKAIELDPKHVKSWINLGRTLLDSGRPEEAADIIDTALSLDPGSHVAFRLKGRALYQLGNREEAADAFRDAIRIDESDAWSMNNLALTLMEDGLYDQALPVLARATELREDVPIFFNNLGMALEHTRHFRDAEDAYQSAVTLDPSYENAHANRTRVEAVEEDDATVPVDLEALALAFQNEIASWSDESVAREQPVPESTVFEPEMELVGLVKDPDGVVPPPIEPTVTETAVPDLAVPDTTVHHQ